MKRRIVRGIAAVLCAAVLMPATAAVMPAAGMVRMVVLPLFERFALFYHRKTPLSIKKELRRSRN